MPMLGATDETFEHLLSCENTTMQDVRNEARKDFRLNCEALKLPLHFTSTLVSIINLVFEPVIDQQTNPSNLKINPLRDAVKQQETIGFYNMLVGFMSKAWTTALDDLNVEQPDTMMDQVLTMVWDICEKVLTARIGILHSSKSFVSANVMKRQ